MLKLSRIINFLAGMIGILVSFPVFYFSETPGQRYTAVAVLIFSITAITFSYFTRPLPAAAKSSVLTITCGAMNLIAGISLAGLVIKVYIEGFLIERDGNLLVLSVLILFLASAASLVYYSWAVLARLLSRGHYSK